MCHLICYTKTDFSNVRSQSLMLADASLKEFCLTKEPGDAWLKIQFCLTKEPGHAWSKIQFRQQRTGLYKSSI